MTRGQNSKAHFQDVLQDFEQKIPRKVPEKTRKTFLSNGKLGEMSFQFRGRDKKCWSKSGLKVFEGISHGKLPTL